METNHRCRTLSLCAIFFLLSAKLAYAQRVLPTLLPEQRNISVRDPSQLPRYRIRDSIPPPTVSNSAELATIPVSLDDIIRMSLERADVIRVLSGVTATSSGQTIYDAAVTNTVIDQNQGRFDPTLNVTNGWNRLNSPNAIFDPIDPTMARIIGSRVDSFANTASLSKINAMGGTSSVAWNSTTAVYPFGLSPLSPQTASSASLNYAQPLLRGRGIDVNMAPIVISRINTELSYFQLKDSVQELVRGTIEAYWQLVAARTDVWSKQQQIDQLEVVVRRVEARRKTGVDNRANLSQVQVSLANARANLITSRGTMINREAALRNLIGLPPADGTELVPHTEPSDERYHPDWSSLLDLASERRPDLIELKLILEADEQQRLIANNSALPQLDAVAQYRWNGIDGTMPNGNGIQSGPYNDWTMGVNFSVPLGLRQSRAVLRQRDLILARDRINIQQGLHNAAHILAGNLRTLDQAYEQYVAFREVREAAKINLDYQLALFRTGTGILINVLQAVTDWGNAISSEANALSTYNTTLATLERQTGTILETHGVSFYEERFGAIGPLGRCADDVCYPASNRLTPNDDRYPVSERPAEEKYDLKRPVDLNAKPPEIDYDQIQLPTLEESVPDVPPSPRRDDGPGADSPTPDPNGSGENRQISYQSRQSSSKPDRDSTRPEAGRRSLRSRIGNFFSR